MRELCFSVTVTVALLSGACVQMQNQPNHSGEFSSPETLITFEKETWRLINQKDLQAFGSYLADDFYDIFPDGKERTKSELLKFLSGADLKDHRLSNFRVTMLNEDAAIVTYRVDAHALIEGKDVAIKNSVTSGWAKRDGKWLNVSAVASAQPENPAKSINST